MSDKKIFGFLLSLITHHLSLPYPVHPRLIPAPLHSLGTFF
jgi:hypothetical protein